MIKYKQFIKEQNRPYNVDSFGKENRNGGLDPISSKNEERAKFFNWLRRTNNLDLWEALLDHEDFSSEQENIMARHEKDRLMKKYEEENNMDRRWRLIADIR